MPRPKTRHVTNAGTDVVILDRPERDQIAQAMIGIGCDSGKAAKFADDVNRAAVFAYELEHQMSTPGQSREWHRAVLHAIDRGNLTRVKELIGESEAEFDGRFGLEIQLQRKSDDKDLPAALERLQEYCESELEYFESRVKRAPRQATSRQLLTEELVRLWRELIGENPPYRDGSNVIFLDILKRTIQLSEPIYFRGRLQKEKKRVRHESLRGLVKRAIAARNF